YKIVLTGGPCGGKSTGLSLIEQELTEKGYKVLVVPETATELITGGIRPDEIALELFQDCLLNLQRKKESIYLGVAQQVDNSKGVVILFDRGCLDAKAFMGQKGYTKMLKNNNLKELEVRDFYDGIFHLMTAANGAEDFYTLGNNKARMETP